MSMSYSQMFSGGASAPLWFSGMTVQKWQTIKSPLDGELYTRTAATGSGATDPANDLANYVAASYRRTGPLAVPPGTFSTSNAFVTYGATRSAPVISAGVRTLLVSATGRGSLTFLGASQSASGTRTARWEVLIDGRAVLDQSIGISVNQAFVVVGRTTMNSAGVEGVYAWEDYSPVEFRRSCEIYITPVIATAGSEYWAYRLRGLA